jgi:glucokinase
MILAGDIGGTHTRLAFYNFLDGHFRLVSASVFPSSQYSSLDEIATKFVDTMNERPVAACFGVAGPVRNGRVETTNLPWVIEAKRLANELHLDKALLINDLEASAWGIATLDVADVVSLNNVNGHPTGNQAVVAAGTGLGEAVLYWDNRQYRISATEGGHSDFAPRTDIEIEMLQYLYKRYGRVSYERALSGPGLVNVYEFLRDTGRGTQPLWLANEMAVSDPAAAISNAALSGTCPLSDMALRMFVSIYGAEAGNLALKSMAVGGVYVAGGIAPKILPRLKGPEFMKAFLDKGRMRPLMESIPVKIIVNEKLALLGAARCASVKSAVV